MWRHRWYLKSVRRGLGACFGRRMGPRIRALNPDVIVSTYPLGSAGLSWLRRHGQLAMPAGLLIAPVLAIITALDPLVSIGIAWIWSRTRFRLGTAVPERWPRER